jgi:hypothetical protein
MNDPYHIQLERQLRDVRMKVHDSMDRPNDPMANVIRNELQKAEDMAQNGHNLRSIEDRLKIAQRTFQQSQNVQAHERIMNPEHSEAFYHNLEQIRMNMRRQSHY